MKTQGVGGQKKPKSCQRSLQTTPNNCKITFGVDSKFSRVLECLEYYAYHARIWAYYQSLAGSIECKGCGLFDGKWENYTYISQVL